MNIENIEKKICVGCEGCKQSCPKQCIEMQADKEGFLYPKIDSKKCIDCGICIKKCPVHKIVSPKICKETISLIADDEIILHNSSSGGTFSILANYVLDNNGIVFGAGYDENNSVVHQYITKKEELAKLQKSKYVQSAIKDTFHQAKEFLNASKMVLFVGTPCQIAGLKKFLNREYESLITVDLICSGVPSPMVWKDYLKYCQNENNLKVIDVDFRDKNTGWETFSFTLSFNNDTKYSNMSNRDIYMKAFLSKLINRPACYNCQFINENHFSDLTIGDFWGVENFNVQNYDKGASIVIINSDKGKNLLSILAKKSKIKHHSYQKAIERNWPLFKTARVHHHRKRFFSKYNGNSVVQDIEKNLQFSIFERLLIKLKIIKL